MRRDPEKPLLPLLLLFLMNIVWLVFLLYCIAFYDDITQDMVENHTNPTKLQFFYLFASFLFQFVSQLCMVIKSRKSPVYRLCESDSDAMKFMSQLFCVFTNSASSLLLGSNHSAPRLLLGCSVEHSRSRLEYG